MCGGMVEFEGKIFDLPSKRHAFFWHRWSHRVGPLMLKHKRLWDGYLLKFHPV